MVLNKHILTPSRLLRGSMITAAVIVSASTALAIGVAPATAAAPSHATVQNDTAGKRIFTFQTADGNPGVRVDSMSFQVAGDSHFHCIDFNRSSDSSFGWAAARLWKNTRYLMAAYNRPGCGIGVPWVNSVGYVYTSGNVRGWDIEKDAAPASY